MTVKPKVEGMHRAKPRRVIANDMYLSTLRSHIEAMGGELDIIALSRLLG